MGKEVYKLIILVILSVLFLGNTQLKNIAIELIRREMHNLKGQGRSLGRTFSVLLTCYPRN